VSSEYSETDQPLDEQRLREQVDQSERVLNELGGDLQVVDAELDELAQRNHQYELLAQVCHSLEELDGLGAAHLFWGQQSEAEAPVELLRNARRQIEEFGEEIARVESSRQSIVVKLNDQNQTLDYLHYDLLDAIEREEKRKSAWLVERDPDTVPYRAQVMPWTRGFEEDQRFRKSLSTSMAASLAIAILVSMIALPIAQYSTVDELPERIAKLVRQERALPPPPPPAEEPVIPEEEIPEPDPEVVEEPPLEQLPESIEKPMLAQTSEPETKEKVKSKGILAFRDSFANRANLRPSAQLGSQARVRNAGADAVGRPERLMVSTSAPGSSGGINLSDISRDFGGGGPGMEGVQLSRVASSIGGGEGAARPLSGGAMAGRTDEEIQIVFDRYKATLYRLYNRELRKDPTLRGQLVLRMTIEPDGTVSLCQLHSSSMDAPLLSDQVVERVRTFDFGAKEDIVAMTIIYPIDFLPAA
jgi:outer membrane biosynthesis protein TonB